MIQDKDLKDLQVVVRGGGTLISHRPVFSFDGSSLHIIQSSTLLTYSTSTCLLTSKYTTPGSSPIANVHVKSDHMLIFTQNGSLITLELPNTVLRTVQVDMSPRGWVPIASFIDFLYPSDDKPVCSHYLALGYPQDAALPVLYSVSGKREILKLCWSVVAGVHSMAMSRDGRFVVAIQEGTLFCKDMLDLKNCKWHSSGTRKFVCVAVHPTSEFVCATGDDSGRVLIWSNVLVDKSPAKTVFHWHTLPVADLAFSPEGSLMFSGGGECTLVKWDTTDCTNKRTLPRMGLPICHVSCSYDGELVAVSHDDNRVHVVDSYSKVVGVVKNLTCCVGGGWSCGVSVDPNNGCVVMGGRPGWVQCYDYKRNVGVYEVDVCQQNYVTGEREKEIPNSVVTVVGFSEGGEWMGTGEARGGDGGESRLKFWKRDEVKGVWVLNTCVDWPHATHFTGLRFRNVKGGGELRAATCGGKEFKVWGVAEVESCHGGSEFWICEYARSYKGLDAGAVCFSADGSLVCGAFGRIVTVWEADGVGFKLSLCHSRLDGDIRVMEFGANVNSHLLFCCNDEFAFVWDVITASLLWVVPGKVDCCGVDPFSGIVLAACGSDLVLLSLERSEPVEVFKDASKSNVKGVAWVRGGDCGLKSFPVFLNGSDEVCGLVKGEEEMEVVELKPDNSRLTGFGVMVAEKRVSGVGGNDGWGDGRKGSSERGYSILREIMDSSPHTMASVKYYCTQLVRSLSVRVNENERLAEMEELVMASGRSQRKTVNENTNLKSFDTSMSSNVEEEKWVKVDLDEVASEDTSWITNVFRD